MLSLEAFNQFEVPAPCSFSTGPEETAEIGHRTEEFFSGLIDSLGLGKRVVQTVFSYEATCLQREIDGKLLVSDDFDTSLWLLELQPIASVRNVRNDYNGQVILFSKFLLLPHSEEVLRRYATFDNVDRE